MGAGTYRERREARAENLREWAGKREVKSRQSFGAAERIMDSIPLGQPILVGHHSEKRHRKAIDRIDSNMRAGVENMQKAKDMASRADGIEDQLAGSIYSDDPDAVEALTARIAGLEAERDRIKAYNAACRRAKQCTAEALALLDDRQREDILGTVRVGFAGSYGSFPAYSLSNLSGNIKRNRDRLAQVKRTQADGYVEPGRYLHSLRRAGVCRTCGADLAQGTQALWFRSAGEIACYPTCGEAVSS